jgi:lipoprotein-releasing system ATP-binding protein
MPGARVDIHALHKSYLHGGRTIEVLRGIELTIGAGEMVAVVGSSGAGKSTFLHVLGTLDSPSQGSIKLDDVDVTRLAATDLSVFRNHTIGFVFQFHHLLPDFTAVENCAMPALIDGQPRHAAHGRATELLERVGLGHRLTHRPGELSGGEQQRVALARALIMRPRVLLADEPTGNLDTETGETMHGLMLDLNRELGMTFVVVTHNADMARRLPRRLRMRDGTIVEETSAEPARA